MNVFAKGGGNNGYANVRMSHLSIWNVLAAEIVLMLTPLIQYVGLEHYEFVEKVWLQLCPAASSYNDTNETSVLWPCVWAKLWQGLFSIMSFESLVFCSDTITIVSLESKSLGSFLRLFYNVPTFCFLTFLLQFLWILKFRTMHIREGNNTISFLYQSFAQHRIFPCSTPEKYPFYCIHFVNLLAQDYSISSSYTLSTEYE